MTSVDVVWIMVAMGAFTSVSNKELDLASIREAVYYGKQCVDGFYEECKKYEEYDSKSLEVGSHEWMMMQNSYEPGIRTLNEDKALEAVHATKRLVERFGLSMVDLQNNLDVQQAWQENFCEEVAPNIDCSRFQNERSFDGTCNNLRNPRWGMAGGTMHRYLAPQYGDGVESPRFQAKDGSELMGPRFISNYFFKPMSEDWKSRQGDLSVMNMAFGQYVDHDITNTAASRAPDGSRLDCCAADRERQECISIAIPADDKRFPGKNCQGISRSRAALPAEGCLPNFRSNVNTVTSYLDLSTVYGSSEATAEGLRAPADGRLNTSDFELMPRSMGFCRDPSHMCFSAGDFRANSAVGLVALHTLYVRFHNQISRSLRQLNPRWSNDKIFHTTRQIVIASHQHITYNEFLPTILGPGLMTKYGLWSNGHYVYNDKVDATIKNGFSTAAYRYGHSQVSKTFELLSEDLSSEQTYLGDTFFKPSLVTGEKGGKLERFFRFLTRRCTKSVSRIFESTVRDDLFKAANGAASDLTSINIQRGRDHGLPPYNKWRQYCGLPPAKHFKSTYGGLTNHRPDVASMLAQIYKDVDDIELYVGGVSEEHAPSSAVGPTFACIIARQFYDLKYGDRFWYEKSGIFTEAQLYAIKQITLAKVICENTNLKFLQRNVFMCNTCNGNVKMSCDKIPDLDLEPFRDPYAQVEVCRNRLWY